jgi:hypothetical protein
MLFVFAGVPLVQPRRAMLTGVGWFILNVSQNSSIKFSILAKKVVGVCPCEGGTGMKKRYTEAQIANALRSVVHRVPIFWLGEEHKVELARFRGSGGRPSASSHHDLLIHVPMS